MINAFYFPGFTLTETQLLEQIIGHYKYYRSEAEKLAEKDEFYKTEIPGLDAEILTLERLLRLELDHETVFAR